MHPVYPALLGALGDAAEHAGFDLLLTSSTQKVARHRPLDAADAEPIAAAFEALDWRS